MKEWIFKWPFWLKDLLHCEQLYFLTPLWVCLCCRRPLLLANVFGHWSQDFWSPIVESLNLLLALLPDYWTLNRNGDLAMSHFHFHNMVTARVYLIHSLEIYLHHCTALMLLIIISCGCIKEQKSDSHCQPDKKEISPLDKYPTFSETKSDLFNILWWQIKSLLWSLLLTCRWNELYGKYGSIN